MPVRRSGDFTVQDDQLHVVLTEERKEPHQGALTLPSGLVKQVEDINEAATLELIEETHPWPDTLNFGQLQTYGAKVISQEGRSRIRVAHLRARRARFPAPAGWTRPADADGEADDHAVDERDDHGLDDCG